MGSHSKEEDDAVVAEAERAVRRVSWRATWMPILIAATVGLLAGLALAALLAS